MLALEKDLVLTPKDVSKHFNFPFRLSKPYSILEIEFRYYPKQYMDIEDSKRLIKECYGRYGLTATDEEINAELPLNNLITISLDSPNGVVGTAHRHLNEATYIVSDEGAAHGFKPTPIVAGNWNVTVSTHAVLSERVDVSVKVKCY